MQDDLAKRLTRPIVGMECRTPLEVFDIMSDRIRRAVVSNQAARNDALEAAAKVAECCFDDRPRSRAGHHSEMDWTDGYREGTKNAAAAIRNMKGER